MPCFVALPRDHSRVSLAQISPLLDQLVRLPGATDVLVNGAAEIWVDVGSGLKRVAAAFDSDAQLEAVARSLMAAGHRHIDVANPLCDVMLPRHWFEGSEVGAVRVHAVLRGVITEATSLSVRVHPRRHLNLDELIAAGMLSAEVAGRVVSALSTGASLLVSGATGTGKTTLLRALLQAVPTERRVVLEDIAELGAVGEGSVALQVRQANTEGRGHIGLAELLRQSLRMRPDRIVIGELRGAELPPLLEAANSGHSIAATLHARSAAQVAQRLMTIGVAQGLDAQVVERLSQGAFDIVLQLERAGGVRRVVL